MKVRLDNPWVVEQVSEVNDCDIPFLMNNIREWQNGTVREDSPLANLARHLQVNFDTSEDMIDAAAYAVLYEAAYRYIELLEQDRDAILEGHKTTQGSVKIIKGEKSPDEMFTDDWNYAVVPVYQPDIIFATFDDPESAMAYIRENGLVFIPESV